MLKPTIEKTSSNKYLIKENIDNLVNSTIEKTVQYTTLDIFSPLIRKTLVSSILPIVVTDIVYEQIKRVTVPVYVSVTYDGKDYIVAIYNNKQVDGILCNLIEA